MRRPKAAGPGVASTPQAPSFLGPRPLAAVLEELSAVLRTLPPERRGDAVGLVVGVALGAALGPGPDLVPDGLMTTREAAARCRVHPWTIRQAIRVGALPSVRLGRALRIQTRDLDAYLLARREGGWRGSLRRSSEFP
jgi:excisionase family DNA binding protein